MNLNLLLIENVKKYPQLYEGSHSAAEMEKIWRLLAKTLNLDKDLIKHRWFTLSERFKSNMRSSQRYAQELAFLKNPSKVAAVERTGDPLCDHQGAYTCSLTIPSPSKGGQNGLGALDCSPIKVEEDHKDVHDFALVPIKEEPHFENHLVDTPTTNDSTAPYKSTRIQLEKLKNTEISTCNGLDPEKKRKRYKKRHFWSFKAEAELIRLWRDRILNRSNRNGRSNGLIYSELVSGLRRKGFNFSSHEVKIKVYNLSTKYRKEKHLVHASHGKPSSWRLFEQVHELLTMRLNSDNETIEENRNLSVTLRPPTKRLKSSDVNSTSNATIPAPPSALPSSSAQKLNKLELFEEELIKRIDASNKMLMLQFEDIRKLDQTMQRLQEESLKVEQRRNEIFEKISVDSLRFQSEIINLLKEKTNL